MFVLQVQLICKQSFLIISQNFKFLCLLKILQASSLRNWTAIQSKELGNYYQLLAHMLLQSNFDQFRSHREFPTV